MILSVEPMESLRYLPFLSTSGWLVTSSRPFENIPDYPERDSLFREIRNVKNSLLINAYEIARELGNQRVSNIVMLGAASEKLELKIEKLENALHQLFGRKGEEVVQLNITALQAGKKAARAT
jgi:indolepyruvate ferredoxin oxidoreductase beta subunit